MTTARSRLLIDLGLLVAFLAASSPAVTGLALHEWLSVAIAVPALFHLIINWDWVLRIARTFIRKLLSTSRLNFAVDVALFISTVAVMTSGLAVSQFVIPALGLTGQPVAAWYTLHSFTADSTLLLLLAHFALHARWFARVISNLLTEETPCPEA